MLKLLISLVIAAVLAFIGWELYLQWQEAKTTKSEKQAVVAASADSSNLPGMPPAIEPVYEQSKDKGAAGLKYFLTKYGKAVKDPRLASIQLDYVVLVSPKDIAEARRVFAAVKQRIGPDSPVYDRVKQLEKTYE